MSTVMSERTFGVEIEHGSPRGVDGVRSLLNEQGFSDWAEQYVHWDGSGVECPSPILQGDEGLTSIRDVMDTLKAVGGYTVPTADGLHVHHGAPEFIHSPAKVIRFLRAWTDNNELLRSVIHPERRTCSWTSPWHPNDVAKVVQLSTKRSRAAERKRYEEQTYQYYRKYYPEEDARYYMNMRLREYDEYGENSGGWKHVKGRCELGISQLDEHGTIEVRLHEGTLDADQAVAWVELTQKFVDEAAKGDKTTRLCKFRTLDEMLDTLGVSAPACEQLVRQAQIHANGSSEMYPEDEGDEPCDCGEC